MERKSDWAEGEVELHCSPNKASAFCTGNVEAGRGVLFQLVFGDGNEMMPDIVFEGDVSSADGNYINLYPYGDFVFKGRLCSGYKKFGTKFGGKSNAKGLIEFQSPSIEVFVVSLCNPNVSLKAQDALPVSILYFENGSENNLINVNGYD